MAKFILAFHGGGFPKGQAAQDAAMAAWGAWYKDIGTALVDGGAPVGKSHTVSNSGRVEDGGANPLSGFSIIEADSQEAACVIAAKNPMVVDGSGSVEVAEMIDMG